MKELLKNIELKRKFNDAEKIELGKKIAEADLEMGKIEEEKKEYNALAKENLEIQAGIISDCCTKLRLGYELKMVEVTAKYDGKEVTFIDKNGVIVEQRTMTNEEQLLLNPHMRDVEDFIRAVNKQEE